MGQDTSDKNLPPAHVDPAENQHGPVQAPLLNTYKDHTSFLHGHNHILPSARPKDMPNTT